MSENELGLFKKIHAVMKDVDYLQKDDQVKFGNTNYKAISEEKVTMAVRKALVEHGLVIIPIEQEHIKDGNLSTVNTKYKIIDVDTGQFEIITSSGTGADTQDKGVGKAMTYAYKYLLLRTFAIPTGEDPDKISSAELDSNQYNQQSDTSFKPITQKQVGMLKSRALEFGNLRQKTDKEVFSVLNIQDITELSTKQASDAIKQLDGWIQKAREEQKGA